MADTVASLAGTRPPFSIKSLLLPLLARPRVAQALKYTVYTALVINLSIYAYDDWMAYKSAIPAGAPWSQIFEQFRTTIDMAAWLGLVLLFELETYALPDHLFRTWLNRLFLAIRLVCYVSIAYAALGYTSSTLDFYTVVPVEGVTDLCKIAGEGRSLQIDSITYVAIDPENCADLSDSSAFYKVPDEISVLDGPMLTHVKWMGWLDVQNAIVWLLVVFLIEIEVLLQSADRFSSRLLQRVRQVKTALYGLLTLNIFLWGASGYVVYAWDAFLWIFGFWAIELNLAEWELERQSELAAAADPARA